MRDRLVRTGILYGAVIVATVTISSFVYLSMGFTLDENQAILNANDIDFDGIIDEIDAFDENSAEWADFDFDGIGSNQDSDDDNDGIIDIKDLEPTPVSEEWTRENLDLIQNCAQMDAGTGKLLCYGELFEDLVHAKENNADVMRLAFDLSKIGSIDDCHFISHEIGHVAFDENPNIFENLRGVDGSLCRGGFYHGIMAAYFHDLKENGKDISSFKNICDEFIGSPDYTKCVHGLGHGLTHYFLDDLNASINACDQMSFYQGSICLGGVMMQYTDSQLTRTGANEDSISTICSKSDLRIFDYQQCNDNLGLSVAFHTNHNYEQGLVLCEKITDDMGRQFCIKGLEREINDAKKYKEFDSANGIRELVQPITIKEGSNRWIVDFRTPSLITDFEYDKDTKTMMFSFDKPYQIIIYISSELLPEDPIIKVNDQDPKELEVKHGLLFEHSMIHIVPTTSGIVLIS